MDFQRKLNMKYLNSTLNYSKGFGTMNATLSEDGALFLFIVTSTDNNQIFMNVVAKFSTDSSDNFDLQV